MEIAEPATFLTGHFWTRTCIWEGKVSLEAPWITAFITSTTGSQTDGQRDFVVFLMSSEIAEHKLALGSWKAAFTTSTGRSKHNHSPYK